MEIGSRALAGSQVLVRQTLLRESLGRLFNRLIRAFLRIPFRDTQCGFKLFRREAAHAVFQRARTDGFAFDVEAVVLALQLGYMVREMPVWWINDPESRVTLLRHPAQMLGDLRQIRAALATDHCRARGSGDGRTFVRFQVPGFGFKVQDDTASAVRSLKPLCGRDRW